MQQTTHTVTQCDTATAGVWTGHLHSAVSGQAKVADNRKPWMLAVITDTGPQSTTLTPAGCSHQRGIHTSGVFSEVWWKEALFSLKESLSVHFPFVPSRAWLPLSHLFSCYLDRCCIYVFTWCFYDICTYFLGIWRLKFTVKHAALGSDTEQVPECDKDAAEHPRCRLERKGGWRRHGLRVKVRKARGRKPFNCYQCCGTNKVRYTV